MLKRILITCIKSQNIQQNFHNLLSKQYFCGQKQQEIQNQKLKFVNLMNLKTNQSLEEAAKMMANQQVKNQSQIQQIRQKTFAIKHLFDNQHILAFQKIDMLTKKIDNRREENKLTQQRLLKQIENIQKYGVSQIIKNFLDIADFLKNCAEMLSEDKKQQRNHLEKIRQDFLNLLKKYGITQFNPQGKIYDPNTQESMSLLECKQEISHNTVAKTLRTGFLIHDRLLRSAQVIIYS